MIATKLEKFQKFESLVKPESCQALGQGMGAYHFPFNSQASTFPPPPSICMYLQAC